MSMRLFTIAAGFAALFSFAALAQTGKVEITEAWARATPPRAENGAVYVTMLSPTADRLVAVETPAARKAEIHLMSMDGSVMTMRQVTGIDLPAGKPVTLKPGAYHIMLVGLTRPLEQGQTLPLTLTFEKAGREEVTAMIEKIGSIGPHAAGHGGSGSMPANGPMHNH